jgi:hypothetical protein
MGLTPLSIKDRLDEIMISFYTSFDASVVKYFIGQKNKSINNATNYIVFIPQSESIIAPHILGAEFDGYDYEFCADRNITFAAECQSTTIESLSTLLSGLIAAIKLTNGPKINPNVQWDTQLADAGITRQGELATLKFDLLFPVPKLTSFLVTPENFDVTVDLVEELPDGYSNIINPDFEIPPYYVTGKKITTL